jgi:seryl-tRNA synthetase
MLDPYQNVEPGELKAEQEIAIKVTKEVFPQLRNALGILRALKETSAVNGVPELIADAKLNDTKLAGFSASDWEVWEEASDLILSFLNTPQESLGGATIGQVLVKRYVIS